MRYGPYGPLNWKTMKISKEIPLTLNSLFSFLFISSLLENFKIFKHYHKSKIKGARFEFYKKQPLILGAAVDKCSGSYVWK